MNIKNASKKLNKNQSREYSLDVLKCISTIIIIFHHYQQLTGVYFENGMVTNKNINYNVGEKVDIVIRPENIKISSKLKEKNSFERYPV